MLIKNFLVDTCLEIQMQSMDAFICMWSSNLQEVYS